MLSLPRINTILLAFAWSVGFGLWSLYVQNYTQLFSGFIFLYIITLGLLWLMPARQDKNLWELCGSAVILLGWFGVFLLLPQLGFRITFLIITLPLFTFLFSTQFSIGEYIITNRMLLGSFFISLTLAGFSQYFRISSTWLLLAGLVLFIGLIRSTLVHIPHRHLVKTIASLVLGLAWVEWFWILTFLPVHYTAIGFILWITFYTAWVLYYHFLFHTLNARKFQFYIFVALFLLIMVLLATPWHVL